MLGEFTVPIEEHAEPRRYARRTQSGIGPRVEDLAVVPGAGAERGLPAGGRTTVQQLHPDRHGERQCREESVGALRHLDLRLASDRSASEHDLLETVWVEQRVGIAEARGRRLPAR